MKIYKIDDLEFYTNYKRKDTKVFKLVMALGLIFLACNILMLISGLLALANY